jgi:Asp-tRNA(Asn)/Glu-tRNA(Gln) amidotransferase C subunit
LRLRDDLPSEADQRADLQAPAPLVRDGLYLVPRVIE